MLHRTRRLCIYLYFGIGRLIPLDLDMTSRRQKSARPLLSWPNFRCEPAKMLFTEHLSMLEMEGDDLLTILISHVATDGRKVNPGPGFSAPR